MIVAAAAAFPPIAAKSHRLAPSGKDRLKRVLRILPIKAQARSIAARKLETPHSVSRSFWGLTYTYSKSSRSIQASPIPSLSTVKRRRLIADHTGSFRFLQSPPTKIRLRHFTATVEVRYTVRAFDASTPVPDAHDPDALNKTQRHSSRLVLSTPTNLPNLLQDPVDGYCADTYWLPAAFSTSPMGLALQCSSHSFQPLRPHFRTPILRSVADL